MITSTIDDSSSHQAHRPRSGNRVRRSMAGLAAAAVLITACGSGEDAVSSDTESSDVAAESQSVEAAEETQDASAEQVVVDAEPAALQQNGPIVVTGTALDPFDSTVPDLAVGSAAPVVEGESFDGTAVTIGGPSDNATFVVFLAHWCPHCRDEVPVLVELEANDRIPEGLDVVAVSTAVAEDRDNYPPSEWLDNSDWPWATIADDEAMTAISAMGGTSFPFAVVLDADGNVLARKAGQASADDTVAFLEAALAEA